MTQRRTVTLCSHTPTHHGARGKLWAFSRADLARLLDVSEATIRRRVQDGSLDPTDLESVARAYAQKYWRELAIEGIRNGTG